MIIKSFTISNKNELLTAIQKHSIILGRHTIGNINDIRAIVNTDDQEKHSDYEYREAIRLMDIYNIELWWVSYSVQTPNKNEYREYALNAQQMRHMLELDVLTDTSQTVRSIKYLDPNVDLDAYGECNF